MNLPQIGRLTFRFSLISNSSNGWSIRQQCNTKGVCTTYSGRTQGSAGPHLVEDDQAYPTTTPKTVTSGDYTYQTNVATVVDASGATHPLGYDSANLSYLRSTDGAGYLFVPATTNLYESQPTGALGWGTDGVLYSRDGLARLYGSNGGLDGQLRTISDPDGNTVTYTEYSADNPDGVLVQTGGSYTDSMGRQLTDAVFPFNVGISGTAPSSSTAGCPTVDAPNQPLVSSFVWSVPGPNGSVQPYQFCFAAVYVTASAASDPYVETTNALQSILLPNGTYWQFIYDSTTPSGSGPVAYGDLLKVITPDGGSISYTYAGNEICAFDASNARTLSTRTTDDGQGHVATWSYAYAASMSGNTPVLSVTVTDPYGNQTVDTYTSLVASACHLAETAAKVYQGTAGSSTPLKAETFSYQSTPNPQAALTLLNWQALTGVFKTSVSTTLNGAVVSEDSPAYDTGFLDAQPVCVYFGSSSAGCHSDGTYQSIQSEQVPLGNVVTDKQYDYGTSGPGSLLRTTSTSYLALSSGGTSYLNRDLIDLVSAVTVDDGSGVQDSYLQNSYDQSGYVADSGVPLGHLTTASRWVSASTYSTTHDWWNANGTMSQRVDPTLACVTTYSYTSGYPTGVTNCLNQTTGYGYDFNTGEITHVTDPNNQTTTYTYADTLGRLTAVGYPDQGAAGNTYNDSASSPSVLTTRAISAGTNMSTETVYDGFGRKIEDEMLSDSTGADYTATTYDGLGRVYQVYNPTRCNPPTSNCNEPTWGVTTYSYDALDRPTSTVDSDGTSTQHWSYNGNVTTYTDENGIEWQRTYDALGRLTKVLEPNGSSTTPSMETDYSYDGLGDLVGVTQWGGPDGTSGQHLRSFVYDGLSRLTSASNPETGTVGYSYDSARLLSKTNARGIITTFSYDALSRITGKVYSNDGYGTLSSCYQYGTSGSNTVGRLINEWTIAGSCADTVPSSGYLTRRSILSYDPVGRVASEQDCTPATCSGTPYALSYGYNLAGDMTSWNNGVGTVAGESVPLTLSSAYDAADRLSTIQSSWTDASFPGSETLFTAGQASSSGVAPCGQLVAYTPGGELLNATFGVGVYLNRGYNSRQQPNCEGATGSNLYYENGQYVVSPQNSTFYTYGVSYQPNGNVGGFDDALSGNWTVTYDTLNRIATAGESGAAFEFALPYGYFCWTYDAFGNRTMEEASDQAFQSGSGGTVTCQPQTDASISTEWAQYSDNKNQISSTNQGAYLYDSSGDITFDGNYQYVRDAEGRICEMGVTISGSTIWTEYIYDADGRRVAKGPATSASCNPVTAGFASSGSETDYVINQYGQSVAELSGTATSGMTWQHSDIGGPVGLLATYDSAGLHFYVNDWLGTRRAQFDVAGQPENTCSSGAYGDYAESYGNCPSAPTEDLFTGKQRDQESGNDYFGARYYASSMGRWLSPDWSATEEPVPYAKLDDPQTMNLYSYVQNNPLSRFDTDGHDDYTYDQSGEQIDLVRQSWWHNFWYGDTWTLSADNGNRYSLNAPLTHLSNGQRYSLVSEKTTLQGLNDMLMAHLGSRDNHMSYGQAYDAGLTPAPRGSTSRRNSWQILGQIHCSFWETAHTPTITLGTSPGVQLWHQTALQRRYRTWVLVRSRLCTTGGYPRITNGCITLAQSERLAIKPATIMRSNRAMHGGIMAQPHNSKSHLFTACVMIACLSFAGCRCAGLYNPVYNERQIRSLLETNSDELTSFAIAWFKDHRDDGMRYDQCHGGSIVITRYARNSTGIVAPSIISTDNREIDVLRHFAKRFKLQDVTVFSASNTTPSWYIQFAFQGGAKWPYGLIYVPNGEPLNILNSANGGPGPGFSKVIPLQGRWLYFESR